MRRTLLKSRIYRATVTGSFAEEEGSVSVDRDLLDAADILPHEQVHVANLTSGRQGVAYVLPGERGSGVIMLHADTAHLAAAGEPIAIASFTVLRGKAARKHEPIVVICDEANKPLMAVHPSEAPATPPMGTAPRRRKSKNLA